MVDPATVATVTWVKNRINSFTVDKLKGVIQGFNDHCGASLSRSGKKSELQDKLRMQLDSWEANSSIVSINLAKKILEHVESHGSYNQALVVQSLSPHMKKPALPPPSAPVAPTYPTYNQASGSNSVAAPRANQDNMGIPFKASPFFEVDQAVSSIKQCTESLHMNDRQTVHFDFTLTSEQRNKLLSTSRTYQLRIYCTTSTYYIAPTAFRPQPTNTPAPIEFPNTCEIRVNGTLLRAQTKGLKKKPGTAPPANLGSTVKMNPGSVNKVEMVYCNNNPLQGQPPNNKKYFLQVMLVAATSVQELVDRLKKGKYQSKEEILATRYNKSSSADDDDIVMGPTKMSLKCPISYMRLATPSRSKHCPHPQCFDAGSWFSMMEITTTWLCPICEKVLDPRDLIVDGYVDYILKITNEDVEDVMVEQDGEWHTSDNKFHSAGWIPPKNSAPVRATGSASSSTIVARSPGSFPPERSKMEPPSDQALQRALTRHRPQEEIILDSDEDEDDVRVRDQIFSGTPSNTAGRSQTRDTDDFIDLTLDSDDDDQPLSAPTTASAGQKRKDRSPPIASSSSNDSLKRSRLDIPLANGSSSSYRPYRDKEPTPSSASSRHSFNLPPLTGFNSTSRDLPPPSAPLRSPQYPPISPPIHLPPLNSISRPLPAVQPPPTRPPPPSLPARPSWTPMSPNREYRSWESSRPW